MLWFLKCRRLFSLFTSNFDILYAGAFLLLTTGLTGWPGLCSLIWALRLVGWGFFWVRYFFCILLMIRSLCCRVLAISFWYLSVGSFCSFWKLFSVRKLWTYLLYSSVYMVTHVLPLSALTTVAFSFTSLLFMCFRIYVCCLAVSLWWLSDVLICFSCLVARILNGACILLSSILIASSVSIIRSVQYFLRVFWCYIAVSC